MTMLAMLTDCIRREDLETLKFDAIAMVVSSNLCNLLVLGLKSALVAVNFSAISIARNFLFFFWSE